MLLIIIGISIVLSILSFYLYENYFNPEHDPVYIKEKIRELEEMPCEEMSENHVHEIEDDEHYAAYDKKFIECFGYIP